MLSPTLIIPITETNFPYQYCNLSNYKKIFWEVELTGYSEDTSCLKLKVLNYNAIFDDRLKKQRPTRKIEKLEFEKFDWRSLEALLTSYKAAQLDSFVEKNPIAFNHRTASGSHVEFIEPLSPKKTESTSSTPSNEIIEISKQWRIKFEDAFFELGYIRFIKEFPEIKKAVIIKIFNDNLLPEFELIKPWFIKKLGKTFQVEIKAKINSEQLIDYDATSSIISAINPNLLENIRQQRIWGLQKTPNKTEIDQSLFTSDEIFEHAIDKGGNLFQQNELEVLEILSQLNSVRNKRQLTYLASQLQNNHSKLRFTLNPHFGFVFHVIGKTQHHFIWELLNSHATYVWSRPKNEISEINLFKELEAIINYIRLEGRDTYKSAYRQFKRDENWIFNSIDHEDANSSFKDGFVKWKYKLEEKLV